MDTPASLLERLRQPAQQAAWTQFVELYTPLLYYWARRIGCQSQDAADLVQEVFTILVQKMPEFVYDPHRSFRSWLRTVTLNKWREKRRRLSTLAVDPGGALLAEQAAAEDREAFWEVEYRQHLAARALELMQAEFQPTTWKACWEHVVAGRPAAEVAGELGMSADAVYAATTRVLRRLRQELRGMID